MLLKIDFEQMGHAGAGRGKQYVNAEVNVLFWFRIFTLQYTLFSIIFCKPWSILAPILRVIFAIPAASSKSEQVFSVAGRVVTLEWNRDGRSAICDCWETCPLCEKPSCSAFDLTFIIQHICSYLVKPALIWKKKRQKWQSLLDLKNSGFWFLFREMCYHNHKRHPFWCKY